MPSLLVANRTVIISSITISLMLPIAPAAIVVTQVNAVSTTIGTDSFEFRKSGSGRALFFGNQAAGNNLNTADRVNLTNGDQYFQEATLTVSAGRIEGSTTAYVFNSSPYEGAISGINFSAYDVDQDGTVDTLFMLNFGPDLLDGSDDLILAYAQELDTPPIDLASARTALLAIPEPSSFFLLSLTGLLVVARRRR